VIELPEHIGEEGIRPAAIAQLMPLIEAHTTERVLRDADAYLRSAWCLRRRAWRPVRRVPY
jgi:carboxymethylenebutenolidase